MIYDNIVGNVHNYLDDNEDAIKRLRRTTFFSSMVRGKGLFDY